MKILAASLLTIAIIVNIINVTKTESKYSLIFFDKAHANGEDGGADIWYESAVYMRGSFTRTIRKPNGEICTESGWVEGEMCEGTGPVYCFPYQSIVYSQGPC